MDVKSLRQSIIRVNHAGEYAAKYIYKRQICASKGNQELTTTLKEMLNTEKEHLDFFASKIRQDMVRPTVFLPLWKVLGFGLGYTTVFFGKKTAMACTVAVEEVIEKHYKQQLYLMQDVSLDDEHLKQNIKRIRQEEIDHKNTGMQNNAMQAPFYNVLSEVIKLGCKLGIVI